MASVGITNRRVSSVGDKTCFVRRFDGYIPQHIFTISSDPLDAELAEQDIEFIVPYRNNRKKPKTQDDRKLRRYKRRWKIEWLFAHLGNFRRLVVRYERLADNFLGFLQLGCIKLLLRHF